MYHQIIHIQEQLWVADKNHQQPEETLSTDTNAVQN